MTGCRAMESSREYERLRQRRYRAAASEEAKNKRRTADADRKRLTRRTGRQDVRHSLHYACLTNALMTSWAIIIMGILYIHALLHLIIYHYAPCF